MLAQILLHTLDMSFKEPFVGIVADLVNARVFSPDSSHQLTVLGLAPCRFQTAHLAVIPMLISASAWACPLYPRLGSLGSRGGATRSAVCSMAVVKAVSTSTLLPLGGNALRWSPITVVSSWRRWGSFAGR